MLNKNEQVLCIDCRINLPETRQHLEPYNQNILNKFAGKTPIRLLTSYVYFVKGGTVQKLIHAIKYKGQKEAAKQIAFWYGDQIKLESKFLNDIDVILGVPLHISRLQQRGYNQADWIAQGIAEASGKKADTTTLVRRDFSESQTNKNRLDRWENVKTAFEVIDRSAIENKNVLLVDDVLTTGATLEACAVELLKSGCKSVSILTLAVADKQNI